MKFIYKRIYFLILGLSFLFVCEANAQTPKITQIETNSIDCGVQFVTSAAQMVFDSLRIGDGITPIDSLDYTADSLLFPDCGEISFNLSYIYGSSNSAYMHIGYDFNGDGVVLPDEYFYSNSSLTGTFSVLLPISAWPSTFKSRKIKIVLSDDSEGLNVTSSVGYTISGNSMGNPPLIATGCSKCKDPTGILSPFCLPDWNFLKFYMYNPEEAIVTLMGVNIYEVNEDASLTVIGFLATGGIEINQNNQEIILPLGNIVLESGTRYYVNCSFDGLGGVAGFYFEVGCCEGDAVVYSIRSVDDNLIPHFTAMRETIAVEESPTPSVIVEAGEEMIFQAGDYVLLMPGFEAQSHSTFLAYTTECISTIMPPEGNRASVASGRSKEEKPAAAQKKFKEELPYVVYPNPFRERIHIEYKIQGIEKVQLDVFNMLGQNVRSIPLGLQTMGRHEIELDTIDFPKGSYIVKLQIGNKTYLEKMITL